MTLAIAGTPGQGSGLGTTSGPIAWPATATAGDLVVVSIATWSSSSNPTVTTPSGWTQLTRATGTGGTYPANVAVLWKILTSADITAGQQTFAFSANSEFGFGIVRFTGADPTTPVNASNQGGSSSAGITLTSPTITTTVDGCIILECWGGDANATITNPITQPATIRTNGNPGGGIVGHAISSQPQASHGSVSSLTATQAGTGSWAAMTLAIAPSTAVTSSFSGWGIPA